MKTNQLVKSVGDYRIVKITRGTRSAYQLYRGEVLLSAGNKPQIEAALKRYMTK